MKSTQCWQGYRLFSVDHKSLTTLKLLKIWTTFYDHMDLHLPSLREKLSVPE